MSDDPCGELHIEYVSSMREWEAACAASQNWISTTPISITEDITPKTLAESRQMEEDFEREKLAEEKYVHAMNAYFECRDRIKREAGLRAR